jgi:hypothetical protein
MEIEFREEEIIRTVPRELADELQDAPLGNLRGSATSPQAVALVDHLAHKYPRVTQAAGGTKRTNRVLKRAPDFDRAIAAFLADLLAVHAEGDGAGWVRLSLDKSKRTGQPVTSRLFNGVRNAWRGAGLIEEQKGYPGKLGFGNPGPSTGRMTRFRATRVLLDACGKFGVYPANVTDHFHLVFEMPEEMLQLTKPWRHPPNTPASQALRQQVAELNAFFARHTLEGAKHIGWVRMFHMAYSRSYAWDKGGRLYSHPPMPATNYQQMPQERRLELRLDGKQVVEIDINASYLTIFYAWHDQQIESATAYTNVVGPDELDRAIVKTWVNASFGNSGLLTRWPTSVKNDFAKRYEKQRWTIDGRKYPVRRVREATLARHPLLKQWGQPCKGKPQDYGDLMYRESQIIISTMVRLATEHDVPSLPVHDSLIVPLSQVEVSQRVLKEQFQSYTGAIPTLKVKRSTAWDF